MNASTLRAFAFAFAAVALRPVPLAHAVDLHGEVRESIVRPDFVRRLWSWSADSPRPRRIAVGDINGDGRSDLIEAPRGGSHSILVGISDGRDTFNGALWTLSGEIESVRSWTVVDFDRDGRDDLLTVGDTYPTKWVLVRSGEGSFEARELEGLPANFKADRVFAGDFSGDGRSDIVAASRAIDLVIMALGRDSGRFRDVRLKRPMISRTPFAAVGDHEGDGLAELYAVIGDPQVLRVSYFDDDEAGLHRGLFPFPARYDWKQFIIGDFNSDGRSDLLTRAAGPAGWWFAFAAGPTLVERPVVGPFAYFESERELLTGDFNGDGSDDLLCTSGCRGEIEIAESLPGKGIAGIRIESGGARTYTDEHGRFTLHGVEEAATITPISAAYRFLPERWVRAAAGEPLSFSAVRIPEGSIGAAVSVFGDARGPYVCSGYVPTKLTHWGQIVTACPDGYAFYAIDDGSRRKTLEVVSGTCCRLPSDDILERDHRFEYLRCPEGYVVTGGGRGPYELLRCTRINPVRYRLGAETSGLYWGTGFSMRRQKNRIAREAAPVALRYGLGRQNFDTWDADGCVGYPWGSLVTARTGGACEHSMFRRLEYAGAPGDPPAGSPVSMLPQCRQLDDPFDPLTGCTPGDEILPAVSSDMRR